MKVKYTDKIAKYDKFLMGKEAELPDAVAKKLIKKGYVTAIGKVKEEKESSEKEVKQETEEPKVVGTSNVKQSKTEQK